MVWYGMVWYERGVATVSGICTLINCVGTNVKGNFKHGSRRCKQCEQ
mgnify:CR=1 FL=1